MIFPRELLKFAEYFHKNNFQCFCVGGAVRDMLLGRRVTDFDIATDALPEDVQRIFRRTVPTGIKHGTVTVLFRDRQLEVTTFRTDGKYSDSRRPDSIAYTPSIEEDLKRRDFTINAIAYDLIHKRVLDPHDGKTDLKKKSIRAIGDPLERFNEDALRLLRACRFSSQLGFGIEANTEHAIAELRSTIGLVSSERIRDELTKTVVSDDPGRGIEYMRETGLLQEVLPELAASYGVEQRSLHCFDVYYHLLRTCEAAPKNVILRFASLFHDIGKPQTLKTAESGDLIFYNHDKVSSEMAANIMKRLKFSTYEINRVSHLVLNHMFNYTEDWSDAAVRRFINRVGTDSIDDLITLRQADQAGTCGKKYISPNLLKLKERIESVLEANHAITIKDLAITGNDIMETLDIKPGPIVGSILDELLETVLDDPEQNTRDLLLVIASRFYKERILKQE
jgi:tRNA nucleotidyltransferase (CCA-adding enzyme)